MARLKGRQYGHVGQIIACDMTLAQFQARYGTGWVLADGSSCVGSTYASITGQTTVPNMNGRTVIGTGTYSDPVSGSITRAFRASGGAERHQLSLAELASHNHGGGSHTHTIHIVGGGNWSFGGNNWATQWTDPTGNPKMSSDGPSTTVVATQGSDSSHNNMQPYYASNVFIRIN